MSESSEHVRDQKGARGEGGGNARIMAQPTAHADPEPTRILVHPGCDRGEGNCTTNTCAYGSVLRSADPGSLRAGKRRPLIGSSRRARAGASASYSFPRPAGTEGGGGWHQGGRRFSPCRNRSGRRRGGRRRRPARWRAARQGRARRRPTGASPAPASGIRAVAWIWDGRVDRRGGGGGDDQTARWLGRRVGWGWAEGSREASGARISEPGVLLDNRFSRPGPPGNA